MKLREIEIFWATQSRRSANDEIVAEILIEGSANLGARENNPGRSSGR